MATTIINPAPNNTASNGLGFFFGGLVLIVFVVLFFVYILPFLRGLSGNAEVQVNVPKSIDVNVHQSK